MIIIEEMVLLTQNKKFASITYYLLLSKDLVLSGGQQESRK